MPSRHMTLRNFLRPICSASFFDADRLAAPAVRLSMRHTLGGGMDADRIVEVEETDLLAEVRGIAP